MGTCGPRPKEKVLWVLCCQIAFWFALNSRADAPKGHESTPAEASCRLLSKSPRGDVEGNPALTSFLQNVLGAIQSGDASKLEPLFHPRLKLSSDAIKQLLKDVAKVAGASDLANTHPALYRLYLLKTDSRYETKIPCDDEWALFAQYGYEEQMGAFLQASGEKEMVRIYLGIVPSGGTFKIGFWQSFPWTHKGQDYQAWWEQGKKAKAVNKMLMAYIFTDIARKLLQGGLFMEYNDLNPLIKEQTELMSAEAFTNSIKKIFPAEKIVWTNTLFVKEGAGLLLRLAVEAEKSLKDIKTHCQGLAEILKKFSDFSDLHSIRCSYVFPKEDPSKEGILGGLLVPLNESK